MSDGIARTILTDGEGSEPAAKPEELILSFHNTHGAIMGERKLLDGGIPVQVMPMPKPIGPGCGMCLRIPPDTIEKVQAFLGETIANIYQRVGESGKEFIPWNP